MKTICAFLLGVALLAPLAVEAIQKDKKQWTEWTQKEAEKMLADSPWAKTQNETDTSEMFFSPTSDPRPNNSRPPANDEARLGQGASNQATNLKYGVRFFSARPIRQAFMRMIQLKQKDIQPEVVSRMKEFAEMPSTDSIIIAVTIEGTDKRSLGSVMQLFNSAVSGTLKNTAYLERNDGKRLFLEEYAPPGRDGFGARFMFPRLVDEKPFLTPETTEIRFVAELGTAVKLNRQFKVADMMIDGQLEY